jgi:4-amino-4-deoxy-L-arabinose transferase-like glycosyltransferase
MNATSQTTSPRPASAPAASRARHATAPTPAGAGAGEGPAALYRLGLAAVLGLSAALNVYDLSRNAWANNFYSAGVKSMLLSLHNFLFISFDPGGLISLDKPPLAVWVMALSAKIFGFTPMSLLLPEAIAGVLCVWVLYMAMAGPFGRPAALLGALCLAVFPAFVAVNRDNNPDALLILLMTVSCWVALKAIQSGRLRSIVLCGLFVALAFNTKSLAAYLVVPGIAAAYLVCAPGPLRTRMGKLLVAGAVMALVSVSWMTFVDLTPAAHRPYVGSSTDNSELGLTFAYNGFGRIDGQTGGPGSIPNAPGAYAPVPPGAVFREAAEEHLHTEALARHLFGPLPAAGARAPLPKLTVKGIVAAEGNPAAAPPPEYLPDGRASKPTAFAEPPGPLRLLEKALGGQAGWLLPLSLGGAFALLALVAGGWGASGRRADDRARGRRDPRLAGLLVLGGWFAVEAVVLSLASGIVHPYYTSALAPGASAMVGAGALALVALLRRDARWAALLAATVVASVATQIVLLDRSEYMQWMLPVLIVAGLATIAIALRARTRAWTQWALVGLVGVLLVAPTGFAAATWGAPVQGTFPVAGPWGAPGNGGVGVPARELPIFRHLFRYLQRHHPTGRFTVLTVSSVTAAPLILWGSDAASLAGYSGTDPALSAGGLAHLVQEHQARYVLLGGPYSSRGGNGATKATIKACRQIPSRAWGGVRDSKEALVLYDCAGRAPRLWAAQAGR